MHEMSYVVRFVNQAIESAREQNVSCVKRIVVSVGEMTGVLPEYLYKYYPLAIKDTILDGSELSVKMIPIRVECSGCGKTYHPTREQRYLCPFCSDSRGRVISGRDVILEQIEVE